MAAKAPRKKTTKKNKQLSFSIKPKDERLIKIIGLVLLMTSLYLFIAFTSHLFTWKIDQDKVIQFSWGLLFNGQVEIANWLGRLGAIVSHKFFYVWFGLPSYLFVFLFFTTGISLVLGKSLSKYKYIYLYCLVLMVWLSTLFAFLFVEPGIFAKSAFSWGGAFGEGLSQWMGDFLGPIGMVLFLIFSMVAFIVWGYNPNFNEFSFNKFVYSLQKKTGIDLKFLVKRPYQPQPEEAEDSETSTDTAPPKALRPSNKMETTETPLELNTNIKESVATPGKKLEINEKGQLTFPLSAQEIKKKAAIKNPEEAELEIVPPTAETPTTNIPVLETNPGDKPKEDLSIQAENKNHLEPYDPTLDLSSYESPVTMLLEDYSANKVEIDREELENNKDQIIETLLNYKIEITKIKATIGPTVTLYEIVPAAGVRISKIKNLEDDIALSLSALGIRIIAPIPGRGTIGIEVPNKVQQIVSLKEVLQSEKFKTAKMDLPIALGKTISNEVFVADLGKMPHLLIAGATGQGKSVGINTILMSLLYKKHPSQLKLILIDPKKVELSLYNNIDKHFLGYLPGEEEAIVTDTSKVVQTLHSLTIEMDQRYDLLKKAMVRNLKEYNQKFVQRKLNPENGHRFMPFLVLVIDEFADLIMTAGKEVELPIGRLAQLARAVGIHLIIATQRPSVNIITGVIKANFPARLAFKVTSKIDSRTILDGGGADQLVGRGDMLLSVDGKMIRLQCAFVDTPEVEKVITYISEQQGYPEPYYLPEVAAGDGEDMGGGFNASDLDEMFEEAARSVVQNQVGSTSMIQRRLKLGYNRAGRIMDQMEAVGIVGPSNGSKAREVLVFDELELERYLEQLRTKRG